MKTTTYMSQHDSVTFMKLRSGAWGVRVVGGPEPRKGESLRVSRKDGSTDEVAVQAVVWRGRTDDCKSLFFCAIERRENTERSISSSRRSSSYRPRSGRCRICRRPITDASYQRAGSGMCGACLYDEI